MGRKQKKLTPIIIRARTILTELESNAPDSRKIMSHIEVPEEQELQISLKSTVDDELIDSIKNIDVNTLTPLEALTTLHELVNKARGTQV